MSASSFHVCYGIRREVPASDTASVSLLEQRRHPLQLAAREHGLRCWWGATTDQQLFFVLVGRLVGQFGWEGDAHRQMTDADVAATAEETRARLLRAGIDEQPAWHFQFEPDY